MGFALGGTYREKPKAFVAGVGAVVFVGFDDE